MTDIVKGHKGKMLPKIKVIDANTGEEIRMGYARESDFGEQKIFKIFTPSELIKATILVVGFSFTAGGAWFNLNEHFKSTESEFATFVKSFSDFRVEDESFHRNIYQKMDDKDTRINCLSQKVASCCPNNATQC